MAYRYFPRALVIQCATDLNIVVSDITGYNRANYKGRTLEFPTFETLSDPIDYFAEAMNTELEHGTVGAGVGTNVTGDSAVATAQIAAAHLLGVERGKTEFKPFPDYYDWLWWMERLHERALDR